MTSQKEELESAFESLKNAQSQLVESEKMASVGILTSGVAHEINNPLNFIQGSKTFISDYIKTNLPEHEPKFETAMKALQMGLDRAINIVQSLNRFNRRNTSYSEKCDIHLIINNCLTLLQSELKNKITVETNYADAVFHIIGNEGELHQLMSNVISNAQQSIDGEGNISISTNVNNGKLKVQVTDSGSGIPEEILAKITDPFFTTKAPGKGTGLGLSISYSIVQKHKGKLDFKSQVGKGTEVNVTFPLGA